MSVLDAFLSTWSNARSTFGDGPPRTGAQYDSSGKLTESQNNVNSAAPDARWTGTASNAYSAANHEHSRVLGRMAGLDQRLASEVTASANVVTSGRRDLDAVRKWVLDVASTARQNQAGERIMLPIVQKGLKELTDTVRRSSGDLNAIGGRIQAIGHEYRALGNQKFSAPNDEATTEDSRKPKIQAVDFRQSPPPNEPSPPSLEGATEVTTMATSSQQMKRGRNNKSCEKFRITTTNTSRSMVISRRSSRVPLSISTVRLGRSR